ncbi:hypothetical protein L1987_01823 [Smallanthus sonchifolius]|uniref:Uncharacterized protein n=1 Tax=Smallanthus sonchifolius TaxID=185202 RepID=A0ACB9K6B2_9ASTR|nr:hypothetical protein L1987_01823 [Smallanthus sonchifolius]
MSSHSDPIVHSDSNDESVEYHPASETEDDDTTEAVPADPIPPLADDFEETMEETPEVVESTTEPAPKRHRADTGDMRLYLRRSGTISTTMHDRVSTTEERIAAMDQRIIAAEQRAVTSE